MRSARWLLAGLVVALLFGVLAASHAEAPQDPSPPAPVPAPAKAADPAPSVPAGDDLARLRNAADPSSAIDAYARAVATAPKDAAVKAAYVRRMVDFGLPEMADAQALEIVTHDQGDGLAWAVLAYMNAKRGRTADALADVVLATNRDAADPFVLRTAGQLAAWFDTRADKTELTDELKASVETMKKALGARPGYADSYSRAKAAYADGSASPDAPKSDSGQQLVQPVEPGAAPATRGTEQSAVPADDPSRDAVVSQPPRTEVVRDTQYVHDTQYVYDTTYVYTDPYYYVCRPRAVVCDPWCPTVWCDPWCSTGWGGSWCSTGWSSPWCSRPCSSAILVGNWNGFSVGFGFGGSRNFNRFGGNCVSNSNRFTAGFRGNGFDHRGNVSFHGGVAGSGRHAAEGFVRHDGPGRTTHSGFRGSASPRTTFDAGSFRSPRSSGSRVAHVSEGRFSPRTTFTPPAGRGARTFSAPSRVSSAPARFRAPFSPRSIAPRSFAPQSRGPARGSFGGGGGRSGGGGRGRVR